MTWNKCFIVAGLLAVSSLACDDDSTTMPTGQTVVIYQDTNYRGDSRVLITGNQPDLDDLPGCGGAGADWDDCISSIRIPSGWEITVFEHDQYSGTSATFSADIPDLHLQMGPCGNDWDDCISSIQVRQK
jgi:peptidase inhibitor family I36